MKNQIRNFVMGAGLAALLWSPTLLAQDKETAEIPFDFHAGNVTLPAGTYSVVKMSQSGVLQLRNEDNRNSMLLMAPARESDKEEARLVFHRYGDTYFLSAIWIPGAPGYSFWKSSEEKEMARGGAILAMAYVPLATR